MTSARLCLVVLLAILSSLFFPHRSSAKPLTEDDLRNAKKIGIMPGTFDPVTDGHIAAATAALHAPDGPDLVVLMPQENPHKDPIPREQRLKMIDLAARNLEGIYYAKSGELYSIFLKDSIFGIVHAIRKINPQAKIELVAGSDLASNHITTLLFQLAARPDQWEVVRRADGEPSEMSPTVKRHEHQEVDMPPLDVSSSGVKKYLVAHPELYAAPITDASASSIHGLNPETARYILENHLYAQAPKLSIQRRAVECLLNLFWRK